MKGREAPHWHKGAETHNQWKAQLGPRRPPSLRASVRAEACTSKASSCTEALRGLTVRVGLST
eukprot:1608950-Rhodomonas_salina.5